MSAPLSEVWFVTGSSVGLGRHIVEAALANGHRVVATARNPRTLDDLQARYPDRLLTAALDVTCENQWREATTAAVTHFGRIDVLVNNAGFGGLGSVESMPLDLVAAQLDTNFMGAIRACQAVLPIMRAQNAGRILLVSSIGARIATAGAAVYYASKAAVSSLAESLALEVAPFNIKVTAVEPGAMRTRFAEAESLKVSPFDPVYEGTVGATVALMRSAEFAAAQQDPAAHAAAILELARMENPPLRLLAGADAFAYGTATDSQRRESDQRWAGLSYTPSPAAHSAAA